MILIDDDEGPDLAVSVENSAVIINDCHLVVLIFIVVCEEVNVSFHVAANPVANPKAKAEANRNFMPRWRKARDYCNSRRPREPSTAIRPTYHL